MNYYDFNDAEEQNNLELIPKNTIAKVQMHIKPGGYNDPEQGWTGGYAKKSEITDSVYLACEFMILEGLYAKRKIWTNIGLYSHKNNNRWGSIGRTFIRNILNSAKGYSNQDNSLAAQEARIIKSFADLDYLEFVALIDVVVDDNSEFKNIIKTALPANHRNYNQIMERTSNSKLKGQKLKLC